MRWLLILLLLLAPLVGVMVWRTADLRAAQNQVVVAAPPAQATPSDLAGATKRLSQAITFKSIAGPDGAPLDPEPFRALTAWMGASYPALTAAVQREQVEEHSLLYTWRGSEPGAPPLLLIGHLDVPAPDPAPGGANAALFTGAVHGGAIWGRGAQAGKGPLVAMLEAANALAARGFKPRRTILFAFGQDGASGGQAGAAEIAQVLAARRVNAWFALGEGPAVIAKQEFTGKPAAMIGVTEKRDLHLLVTAAQQTGASDPQAVTAVAQAVVALDAMPNSISLTDEPTHAMLRALAADASFSSAFVVANSWLFSPLIRMQVRRYPGWEDLLATTLSTNLIEGGANQYLRPSEAMAMINVRLHPRDKPDEFLGRARRVVAAFPGVRVDWAEKPGPQPPIASAKSDAFHLLASLASGASRGATIAPCLHIRASDARYYSRVARDVYLFTPAFWSAAEIADIARPNEHLSQANLARMIEFYQSLILEAGA